MKDGGWIWQVAKSKFIPKICVNQISSLSHFHAQCLNMGWEFLKTRFQKYYKGEPCNEIKVKFQGVTIQESLTTQKKLQRFGSRNEYYIWRSSSAQYQYTLCRNPGWHTICVIDRLAQIVFKIFLLSYCIRLALKQVVGLVL